MAKTKTSKTTKGPKAPKKSSVKKASAGALDIWDVSADDPVTLAGTENLAYADRALLGRVARFLFSVVEPRLIRRAVRAGYSAAEHDEVWRLFNLAAGRELPLPTELGSGSGSGGERRRLLVEIDEFENTWFPRTRDIVRRYVKGADADAFLEQFFQGLEQQPLGPTVADSVAKYLDRVAELAKVKWPGAPAVLQKLRERGVTEERAAELREKIARVRQSEASAEPSNAKALRDALAAQATALEDLRLAWNDWATTLRPLYNVREQIQLGLTEVRVRAAPEGDPPPDGAPAPSGETK